MEAANELPRGGNESPARPAHGPRSGGASRTDAVAGLRDSGHMGAARDVPRGRRFSTAKLAESAALATIAMVLACSDHHVSPWGTAGVPPLSVYAAPPDLQAKLDEIDA